MKSMNKNMIEFHKDFIIQEIKIQEIVELFDDSEEKGELIKESVESIDNKLILLS